MTSMTTSQQTDRSGADEIPGPRGGQGVRLLVLGADPDAQDLRAQAQAAGYELAQRYSARVSHVAYGSGIDPGDARYAKIRDAGLALLPLQKCAEQLGLRADAAVVDAEVSAEAVPEVEPEAEIDDEPLDFPPLHTASDEEAVERADTSQEPEELDEPEQPDDPEDPEASERLYDHEIENAFVPGFAEEPADLEVPLAAVVLGADPWDAEQEAPAEPVSSLAAASSGTEASLTSDPTSDADADTDSASASDSDSSPTSDSGAGRVLISLLWALIPLATFGLLTPVTFGYAAYRLRSRGLGLTAFVYTLAVVVSFVLSAIRPHASTPADTTGALLTVCLAGTWIGGTLHALSLRTRVFAR
jgi:hypothetical protein